MGFGVQFKKPPKHLNCGNVVERFAFYDIQCYAFELTFDDDGYKRYAMRVIGPMCCFKPFTMFVYGVHVYASPST